MLKHIVFEFAHEHRGMEIEFHATCFSLLCFLVFLFGHTAHSISTILEYYKEMSE